MTLSRLYHLIVGTNFYDFSFKQRVDIVLSQRELAIPSRAEAERWARCMRLPPEILQNAHHRFALELSIVQAIATREGHAPEIVEWIANKLHNYHRTHLIYQIERAIPVVCANIDTFHEESLETSIFQVVRNDYRIVQINNQAPEIRALNNPVPEIRALNNPVPEIRALNNPVPEIRALDNPVPEIRALDNPAPEIRGPAYWIQQRILRRREQERRRNEQRRRNEERRQQEQDNPRNEDNPRNDLKDPDAKQELEYAEINNCFRVIVHDDKGNKTVRFLKKSNIDKFDSLFSVPVENEEEDCCMICMAAKVEYGCGREKCTAGFCHGCFHSWFSKNVKCTNCQGEHIPLPTRH